MITRTIVGFGFGWLLAGAAAGAAETAPRFVADLAYLAPDRAEKLDLFLPAPPPPGRLSPAVVWIHGGGWTGGTKNEPRAKSIAAILTGAGYVVVSIDYNLGDGAWPLNLLDCKNAVRFLRANAAKYRLDPERIAVSGGSAGGHLALMVGLTTPKKLYEPDAPYPGVSNAVACVINLYGPGDLRVGPDTPLGKIMVGQSGRVFASAGSDALSAASPVNHVTRNAPPVMILHGRIDTTVEYQQSDQMAAALKAGGVPCEYLLLDNVGHSFDWTSWKAQPLPRDVRAAALAFLERHLAPKR
jgi:acetyl esterase/lipase